MKHFVLAVAAVQILLSSLFAQAFDSESVYETEIELFHADQLKLSGLIHLLNMHSPVPIHCEWSMPEEEADRKYSITMSDVSLIEAIRVVAALLDSRLLVNENCVNIISNNADALRLAAIETKVETFEVEDVDRYEAFASLARIDELVGQGVSIVQKIAGRVEKRKFDLHLSNVTPREAMNAIAEKAGHSYWMLSYPQEEKYKVEPYIYMGFSFYDR